jgi:hypothetical protein
MTAAVTLGGWELMATWEIQAVLTFEAPNNACRRIMNQNAGPRGSDDYNCEMKLNGS